MNKKILSKRVLPLILLGFLILPSLVFATIFTGTGNAPATAEESGTNGVNITNPLNGVNNFSDLFGKIVTTVGEIIAALGTIMIIVAGILYLTSAGSPERINTAKKALVYAIIGIIVGTIAATLVNVIKGIIGA